jgi:hypothetical protein
LPDPLSQFLSNSTLLSATCIKTMLEVSCRSKCRLPVSMVRSCQSLARAFPLSFLGKRGCSSSLTPGGRASYA